jgi:hypothetical protein
MNNKKINFDGIMDVVCRYYNLKKEDVLTKRRYQELVTARHMFCNMCRMYTRSTTTSIGKYIQRDHASVIFGSNKINSLYDFDKETRVDRDAISEVILGKDMGAPSSSEVVDIDWRNETITFTRGEDIITEKINKFLSRNQVKAFSSL